MSSIDLSRFNFSGGENSAPIEDLTRLPQEDQQRLVLAGIDVHDTKVSGAFMQLNHADVHCTTRQEGLDLMDIRAALKKVRRPAAVLLEAARSQQGRDHPHGLRAP